MIDLSDYTEAWLLQEYSGGPDDDAVGELGYDIPRFSGPLFTPVAGHVQEDNTGDGGPAGKRCRGWFQGITPTTDSAWFVRVPTPSDILDIQGHTSWAFTGWIRVRSGETGEPWFAGNLDPNTGLASDQAWRILPHHSSFGDGVPAIQFLDGISAWNNTILTPTEAMGVDFPYGEWQFLACGYDGVRKKVWIFWGRDVGESYYNETDGYPAGFGYDGTGEFWIGKYNNAGGGNNGEFASQQCLWWQNRVVTQADLEFLWNDHVGRAANDLINLDDGIASSLTVQNPTIEGLTAEYVDADPDGDTFLNDGYTILHIKNGGGTDRTITVAAAVSQTTKEGWGVLDKADSSVTISASGEAFLGPFPTTAFSFLPTVTYDDESNVTLVALRITDVDNL